MAWKELWFVLGGLDTERVESALEELGALAVTLEDAADDALLEPAPGEQPLWRRSRVRALFSADCNLDTVMVSLRAQLGGPLEFDTTIVEDQQWETAWRRDFKPMQFGEQLWVCPSGEAAPKGATVVRLDPGLAFGTGTHPTTALCLEWLARVPLAGQRVIDYGCGSGILAVAAAKLGAERVYAVDYDAQALTATHDNAVANGVAGQIETAPPERLGEVTAGYLVANILARPLTDLAETFAARVEIGGRIALSGILQSQCGELAATYSHWFKMNDAILRDEWALLEGQRK